MKLDYMVDSKTSAPLFTQDQSLAVTFFGRLSCRFVGCIYMHDVNLSKFIRHLHHDTTLIVILTGAGMSAESGIPTFRDAQSGLWSQFDPTQLASAEAYREDKALVWGWYVWRMAMVRRAQPHAGHRALAQLAVLKPGTTVVTQNVDDLHERAGSPGVLHLHGSLFDSRCLACARPCGDIAIPAEAAEQPSLRVMPPRCGHCGGYVRPGVVWFGERMPQGPWKQAVESVSRCDLLIAVGTSGVVYPAASLPAVAKAAGARVLEINPVATELSVQADLTWRTTAAEGLPALVALLAAC